MASALLEKLRQAKKPGRIRGEADLLEKLPRICQFLQDRNLEAKEVNEHTHCAPNPTYTDWWSPGQRRTQLLLQADSAGPGGPWHTSTLYTCIAELWEHGVPLTLCEQRPRVFRFFLDVTIDQPPASCGPTRLVEDGAFVALVSRAMGALYPSCPFLDVVIFDGSGVSKGKNLMQTVLRMVWPAIGVTAQRALQIRDFIVWHFKESQDQGILALTKEIEEVPQGNPWASKFLDAAYTSRAGVQMPLCDGLLSNPLVVPEGRPLNPLRVVRAHYEKGYLTHVELIAADRHAMPLEDWVKVGCIRPKAPMEETEWAPPKVVQVRPRPRMKIDTAIGSDPTGKKGGGGEAGGAARAPQPQAGKHEAVKMAPGVACASLPSNVYAPVAALQPAAHQQSPTAAAAQQVPVAPINPPVCIAEFAFVPEADQELELAVGDRVQLTESSKAADDGWAKGINLRTQLSGWFPFDYVTLAE